MNKNVDCNACSDLNKNASAFMQNGVTTAVCNSLKNDTGFNPSLTVQHTDCEDLDDATDCLIGMMEKEINSFELCDWKKFMKLFINNLTQLLKAIICAICGIWTNIHKHDCEINYLFTGASFSFGEYTSEGDSYIVAGKGVSFANVNPSGTASDVKIVYVAGGMSVLSGSCMFYSENFTDAKAVANYDEGGVNPKTSASRLGNTKWTDEGYLGAGGELVYELRIKKSEYPEILRFWSSHIGESAGGAYHGRIAFFNEGSYADGQHGWVNHETGEPQTENSDVGHLVPEGWMYLQVRIQYIHQFNASENGYQYSPYGNVPIRMRRGAIDC